MKVNPETRAKKAAAAINQVKVTKHSFTYNFKTKQDELVDMLKKSGCPYPVAVSASLVRHNFIKKEAGLYTFITNGPIHFSALTNDLTKASETVVKSNAKGIKKTNSEIPVGRPEVHVIESKVFNDLEIINYLKAKGYKILKPITQFEEC